MFPNSCSWFVAHMDDMVHVSFNDYWNRNDKIKTITLKQAEPYLLQTRACLFGAKSFSEPFLTYSQLDLRNKPRWKQNQNVCVKGMPLKMSSTNCLPFGPGLNMLWYLSGIFRVYNSTKLRRLLTLCHPEYKPRANKSHSDLSTVKALADCNVLAIYFRLSHLKNIQYLVLFGKHLDVLLFWSLKHFRC